jgi:DNA-binding NarL/FixJ family response regulator
MLPLSSFKPSQECAHSVQDFFYEKTQTYQPTACKEEEFLNLIHKVQSHRLSEPLEEIDESIDEIIFKSEINGYCYSLVCSYSSKNSRSNLSPRELEIVELVAQGLPNKSIAEALNISPWTVATYLRRMFTKLAVSSRAALVAKLGVSSRREN